MTGQTEGRRSLRGTLSLACFVLAFNVAATAAAQARVKTRLNKNVIYEGDSAILSI